MIRRNALLCALFAVAMLGMTSYATAADIKIDIQDAGTGQGLDDLTPATPVGGNLVTTHGEQT